MDATPVIILLTPDTTQLSRFTFRASADPVSSDRGQAGITVDVIKRVERALLDRIPVNIRLFKVHKHKRCRLNVVFKCKRDACSSLEVNLELHPLFLTDAKVFVDDFTA